MLRSHLSRKLSWGISNSLKQRCTSWLPSCSILDMSKQTEFLSESVGDIPLLVGLMKDLRLAEILDRCLVTHGNHSGLSRGKLGLVWLTFILSQGDHRKSTVQAWVSQHETSLERLLQIEISPTDFTDDRLGLFSKALSKDPAWEAIEKDWWAVSLPVLPPNGGLRAVRVDATTVSGYHHIIEGGLMQQGNSKAHRPDLGQFKLMSSAHQPSGRMIATDIHPGQSADDPLYVPIIRRTKGILEFDGVLFLGDCKMASLETRAQVASMRDFYLTPLPMTGKTKDLLDSLVTMAIENPGKGETLFVGEEEGVGFEHARTLEAILDGKTVEWAERLFLVQFPDLKRRQSEGLESQLSKAQEALLALTPKPGKGKRIFRSNEELQTAIDEILSKHDLAGLLDVKIEVRENRTTKFIGRGRGGTSRETREIVDTRYFVQTADFIPSAIENRHQRLGWRIFATNMPADKLSMMQGITEYRKGWGLERNFHVLKDKPLGISPLFVMNDDQITGLTRLLLLGNRVMSEIELRVRSALRVSKETLAGLYPGLPKKETATPTATKLLKKVAEAKISLISMKTGENETWHLTNLPPILGKIMGYLGLNTGIYTGLVEIENAPKEIRER